MIQNSVVEKNFSDKLISPVPSSSKIFRYNAGNCSGHRAKSVIRQRSTARTPRVQFITVVNHFMVQSTRKIVDKDFTKLAGILLFHCAGGERGGGGGEDWSEVVVGSDGSREVVEAMMERTRNGAESEEEEDLNEEDGKEKA
jgi:hypothetical protein